MKKILFSLAFSCLIFITCIAQGENKSIPVIIEQQQGLTIFCLCKPVQKYDYIGSIKIKAVWTGYAGEMLNTAIRLAKKKFPEANAIIFTSQNMDRADCIKIIN